MCGWRERRKVKDKRDAVIEGTGSLFRWFCRHWSWEKGAMLWKNKRRIFKVVSCLVLMLQKNDFTKNFRQDLDLWGSPQLSFGWWQVSLGATIYIRNGSEKAGLPWVFTIGKWVCGCAKVSMRTPFIKLLLRSIPCHRLICRGLTTSMAFWQETFYEFWESSWSNDKC